MNNRSTDIAAGLAVLIFAAMFHFQSGELDGVSLIFPRGLTIFMTCGGLYLLAKGFISRVSKTDSEPVNLPRVVIISVGSIAYVLTITILGFYPASAFFLFIMAMILSDSRSTWKHRVMSSTLFSVVMCTSIWFVFAKLLSVPTPTGIFL